VLAVLAVAALPFLVQGPLRIVAISALIYAMLAASWNLTLGFGGIFNFAHVGFFGVGGYTMAITSVSWQWNPWVSLAAAALTGGIAGALAYLPVVRMRGIYIALITFVFVQLCYYLVLATPGLTGGSNGLSGVPSLRIGALSLAAAIGQGYLWLLGAGLLSLYILLRAVMNSGFGKSLVALRDNENLAVSRGMNRIRQQILAFILSGSIAGVTGALYVSYFRVADVTLFSFGFVTLGLSMIFLGGTGHIWGPMLGAVVVTLLDRQLTELGSWRAIIIGVGTLVVLIFLPRGISGVLVVARSSLSRRRTRQRTETPNTSSPRGLSPSEKEPEPTTTR
jgi:branched-chain amino acid transport system permease protein